MRPLELTGQRFGRLVVLSRAENDKYSHQRWVCRCDCGKERTIVKGDLKRGDTKSCGCLQRDLVKRRVSVSLVGEQFGRLTVVAYEGTDKHQKSTWLCSCVCGSKKIIGGAALRSGKTKSCGCVRVEMMQQKKYSAEELRRRSESRKGEKNPQWKGGVTPKHRAIRTSKEYKNWRTAVFVRDDYSCQGCGTRGGHLHAHHLKAFSLFPELIFEVSNGQTLCVPCHKKTPDYAVNKKYAT